MMDMGRFRYAHQGYDPTKHVRASMREKSVSHKHMREIAKALTGLSLDDARSYLNDVLAHRRAVAFGRFKNQVGHKSDPGMMAGRYPEKAATQALLLIDNLESNAGYKGMDLDRLRIINATSHKGVVVKRFIPRAHGTATPNNNNMTHLELVAQEI